MSLPGKLLEDLLSRYMDGELSVDEEARVEQMLSTDVEAQQLLDVLRVQSALIKSVVAGPATGRGSKLSVDFAARVVDLAILEAVSSNLPATHPLRRAERMSEVRGRKNYGMYAGLVALAAGIMLAGFLIRNRDNATQLAESTPEAVINGFVGVPVAPLDDRAGRLADLANEPIGTEMRADEPPEADSPPMIVSTDLTVDQVASDVSSARTANPIPPTAIDVSEAGMGKLRAVFVYEVVITSTGRENNVVGRVFREAGIQLGDERKVDDTLVRFLREGGVIGDRANELVNLEQPETDNAKQVQLLFLEGSGRKLESCMLKLLASTDDVRQVGFNMLMNPPVVAAMDSLKDADVERISSVKPEGAVVARNLSPSGNEGPRSFAVNDELLPPLDRGGLSVMSLGTESTANGQVDFTTQVLMIIRYE